MIDRAIATPSDSEVAFRRAFVEQWGDRFRLVPLKDRSKRAARKYRGSNGFDSSLILESGNYGLIPQKDVFILDIDVHDPGNSVNRRVEYFSRILQVDLRKTFSVKTPSGGQHFYLRFPMDYEKFKKDFFAIGQGRIAGGEKGEELSRERVGFHFDTDIRTPESLGYVVGAFSSLEGGRKYEVDNSRSGSSRMGSSEISIVKVSIEGMVNFKKNCIDPYVKTDREGKSSADPQVKERELHEGIVSDSRSFSSIRKHYLEKVGDETSFHRKRAVLFGIMGCCHNETEMARFARELMIDRDTFRDRKLPESELVQDFERMRKKYGESQFHSKACFKKSGEIHRPNESLHEGEMSGEEYTIVQSRKIIARMRKTEFHTGEFNPRVIDSPKILESLLENSRHGRLTKKIRSAMSIVNRYFQPLCNVGGVNLIVHRGTISKELGLTDSSVAEGMRLLRETGVVSLKSKQRPGMASVYEVSEEFTHRLLTYHLRKSWGSTRIESEDGKVSHSLVFFSPGDKGFVDLISGEYLYGGGRFLRHLEDFIRLEEILAEEDIEPHLDLLQRYSRKMVEKRNTHARRVEAEMESTSSADGTVEVSRTEPSSVELPATIRETGQVERQTENTSTVRKSFEDSDNLNHSSEDFDRRFKTDEERIRWKASLSYY